ncbi:MAG: thiamine pyrophosphate-binding protein [Chloroflexi bacterium]|nr:thiamine pyrophosphate-binding protein [Chloroflexota bacterium]
MTKVTGGEAIVKSIIKHGVDTLFALPGVQNDYFFNALYDAGDQIRVIHTRHEQGAAYMALGYTLSTGKVGAYSVVPGVGLLNTTAALATAYSTNAKVLCLTGQIASTQIGRGFGMLHEIPDQLGILRSLTKWAERINSPAEAPGLVDEAFRQLYTGRPRPVGLECPPDILATKTEVGLTAHQPDVRHPPVDTDALEQAAKLLGQAKNPLIFVGGGALDAGAEVLQLAELLQAPVVSNRSGHGVVSSRHYLATRMPAAHVLWEKADVVLAVGARMQQPLLTWGYDDDLKVIRIDIDPTEQQRIAPPTVSLVADSQDVLRLLIPAVEKYNKARPSRQAELASLKAEVDGRLASLEPQMTFIKLIREELPDDGFFVEEMTQIGYISRFALPVYQPRTFVSTGYQGTLGWGFATALGVKVANPDKAVLSVNGDGGFMFTVQELATAVQHQISTVSLVFNDNAFGNVQRMQKLNYGNRVIATDLRNPDFVKLAEAFGAQGIRAKTPDEVRQAIRQGFATKGPTLIEVPVGEMPSPWSASFLPRVRPARTK